jgi:MHS family proline/betaine transporter-like MFS transporter
VVIALFIGVQPAIMVEAAPARVRCTAVALGYNLSLGIIGGLTPFIATLLVAQTGSEVAPAVLVMAAAALAFAAALRFKETYRAPLDGESKDKPEERTAPARAAYA